MVLAQLSGFALIFSFIGVGYFIVMGLIYRWKNRKWWDWIFFVLFLSYIIYIVIALISIVNFVKSI